MNCAICWKVGDVRVPGHGAFCDDCLTKALSLLRRVESGDAVVIEKRDGEWPLIETDAKGMVAFRGTDYSTQRCAHIREAAAAWNKETTGEPK